MLKEELKMKITTFNPQIFTNDAAPVEKLFEELGFEKRHDQKNIGDQNAEGIRMKNESGFYLDISQSEVDFPRDLVGIRINVDDFDEAYKFFTDHGFKNYAEDRVNEVKTSKSAVLISPSGFGINLVQHIKNN